MHACLFHICIIESLWRRSARAHVPISCHSVVTFNHFLPRDARVTRGGLEDHAHMQISSSGLCNARTVKDASVHCQAMGVNWNVCKFDISFWICMHTYQSACIAGNLIGMHFNLFKRSRGRVMCPVSSFSFLFFIKTSAHGDELEQWATFFPLNVQK